LLALPSLPVFSKDTEVNEEKQPASKIGKYQLHPSHRVSGEAYLGDTETGEVWFYTYENGKRVRLYFPSLCNEFLPPFILKISQIFVIFVKIRN
jgi:hypothetical protein